jgi:cytosine/adenosine deaminase-related metal-dependent hydrolase
MSDEEVPIKIVIPVEEEPPFVPERPPTAVTGQIGQAGKQAAETAREMAQKAWRSQARRKMTRVVRRGTTAVAAKGSQLVQERVVAAAEQQARERMAAAQTRLRETDWQAVAKREAANGLRWLSRQAARLAERLAAKNRRTEENRDE